MFKVGDIVREETHCAVFLWWMARVVYQIYVKHICMYILLRGNVEGISQKEETHSQLETELCKLVSLHLHIKSYSVGPSLLISPIHTKLITSNRTAWDPSLRALFQGRRASHPTRTAAHRHFVSPPQQPRRGRSGALRMHTGQKKTFSELRCQATV